MSQRLLVDARRWQLQAENDLAYAQVGLAAGCASQTCFMAQQVAEEALKAALLASGEDPSRTHSRARIGQALARSRL